MAERLSYAPAADAGWTIIAAPHTLIALDRIAAAELVSDLWMLARDGASFERLVGAMPAESAGRPLSFVLLGDIAVGGRGASFMALVNGPVGFDIASGGAPHHIAPSGSAPWLRTRLQNVSHVAIGQPAASVAYPLVSGVVAASRIDLAFGAEQAAAAPAAPAMSVTPASPAPGVGDASAMPPSAASPTIAVPGSVAAPSTVRPAVAGGVSDTVFDHSIELHDGMTIRRTPSPSAPVTGPIRLPNVPDGPRTLMFGYRVNKAQPYALDVPHRFGRNPKTRSGNVRLVPLLSPTKTVSATHMDIRQVGDLVIVSDLDSTNGTSVIVPGGTWRRLQPGESIVVPSGTFVDVGDGNVVEIMPGVPVR